MFVPTLALLLVGCGSAATAHDRGAELAACELISSSGDELARCLVMKYDWPADTAGPAKYAWQGHLVSHPLQRRTEREPRDGVVFSDEDVHGRSTFGGGMRPGGFEPPTNSLEGCCSIHLSYGRERYGVHP